MPRGLLILKCDDTKHWLAFWIREFNGVLPSLHLNLLPSTAQTLFEHQGDRPMKTILAAVAFAALLASPVFAQSFDPEYGSGNILQFSQGPTASLSTKI